MNRVLMGTLALSFSPLLGCGEQLVGWHKDDITAPTVLWTTPEDGAQEVGLRATVLATFSEAMAPASLNNNAMTLSDGDTRIDGEISVIGSESMLFTPTDALRRDTLYTAVVFTSATDLSGDPLDAETQ